MKKMIYILLPLQVLILILSPRFGWKMHNTEATVLSYGGTTYTDGSFHALYKKGDEKVDIRYESLFSKRFFVTVNDSAEYEMKVEMDGNIIGNGSDRLYYIGSDLVWNDSIGIFAWRYILTIAMTVLSIILIKRANCIHAGACILYVVSLLISFRILF